MVCPAFLPHIQSNIPGGFYNIYLEGEYRGTSVSPRFRVGGLIPETEYNFSVTSVNSITGEESEPAPLTISTLSLSPVLPATQAPVIDRQVDDVWNTLSTTNVLDKLAWGVLNSEQDHGLKFRTMWDQDAYYILAETTDDSIVSWDLISNVWEFDGIEIYLDRDNDKWSGGFYDENDVQLRFLFGVDTILAWYAGHPAWIDLESVEYADAVTETGFNMEIKFPWASLGVTDQGEGRKLGMEITSNDNDGFLRKSIIAWNAIQDDAWKNPGVWGTLVLLNQDSTLNLYFEKDDSHSDIPGLGECAGRSPPLFLSLVKRGYPGNHTEPIPGYLHGACKR